MNDLSVVYLLSGLQSDYDEDGSPVHSTHTAAVAHKIIEDGCKLSPDLQDKTVCPTVNFMLFTGLVSVSVSI